MKYYHITKNDLATIQSILKNGLRCNSEGEIFVFENKRIVLNGITNTVADIIAQNQVFLNEYVMFEIDKKGIISKIKNDNVGEISSGQQWYFKQPFINKKYIQIYGEFKNQYKNFY